jgi:hypothetical protein
MRGGGGGGPPLLLRGAGGTAAPPAPKIVELLQPRLRGARAGGAEVRLHALVVLFACGLFGYLVREGLALVGGEIFAREEVARRVHERLQVVVQVHRRLVAILDVLRERLEHDLLELVGDATVVGRGRHDLDVADLLQRGEVALADEEALAGEQLVEHDAHREDVAAAVERKAPDLLGATCTRTCP